MSVLVSVLVPVLDEERHLERAAAGMLAQRVDGEMEVLFMDGGSKDRTPAILRDLATSDSRVRTFFNPARVTPVALNIGLRHAKGEFVARMDAHTHYPPDYLQRGIDRLRRGDVEQVSGAQIAVGEGRWSRRTALALDTWLGTGGAAFRRGSPGEVVVDSGFTGVWRRSTLQRHGGWDEGWPVNQDAELAARIRACGGRLVCIPEMDARYIARDDLRALARQYRRYGFYRAKTARRHPGSLRVTHLLAPAVTLAAAAGVAAPAPLRQAGRVGVGVYAAAVFAVAASRVQDGPRDAAALPLVFAAMHFSWGAGFLAGVTRHGVPHISGPGARR